MATSLRAVETLKEHSSYMNEAKKMKHAMTRARKFAKGVAESD